MDFSYLTVLPRGRQIWDPVVFPVSEFDARKEKLEEIMDKLGVYGLLVYSDGLNRRYVNYLTNYCNSVSWSVSICIVTRDADPVIISTMAPRDINYNKKSLPPKLDLRAVGLSLTSNHHVAVKTIDYLKENGLMEKRWGGVNLHSLSTPGYAPFKDAFADLPDCTEAYDKVLAQKSEHEMFAISQASTMAKKAALDYLRMAVPGQTEMEIAAIVDRKMRVYGVENIAILVSSGTGAMALHQPRDYVIQQGDTVCVYVCVMYLHYNGTYAATAYKGVADGARLAFYADALELWNNTLAKIGQRKALSEVNTHHAGDYIIAHGIGVDLCEAPKPHNRNSTLTPGNTILLTVCTTHKDFGSVIMNEVLALDDSHIYSLNGPGVRGVSTWFENGVA